MAGDAFLQLARAFLRAKDQGLTECALLEVPVTDGDCVAAASALRESTRQSDYMGSVQDGVPAMVIRCQGMPQSIKINSMPSSL